MRAKCGQKVSLEVNALSLTKPMEMVASAKGSPMMLARLNLLRLEVFMLYVFTGFFKDGEYNDL